MELMRRRQQGSQAELLYDLVVTGGRNIEPSIRFLFEMGASLEWTGRDGKTPLMVACMNPNLIDIAKTLIQLGANVNAYRHGRDAGTPLHHVAKEGLDQTVALLLSHGANALLPNDDGQTALEIARLHRHTKVVRTIENHVCYFSGSFREIISPRFLGAIAPRLFSRKVWVVIIPIGPNTHIQPLKLELAVYCNIESLGLNLHLPLRVVGPSVLTAWLKIIQAMSPSIDPHSEKNSLRLLEMLLSNLIHPAAAAGDTPLDPHYHQITEVSNTNEQGMSAASEDSYNGLGSAVGTTHSEANNSAQHDYISGWSVFDHDISSSTSPAPSAPPIPDQEHYSIEGSILYPTIDIATDVSTQAKDSCEASTSDGTTETKDESISLCVICWEGPIEGAFIPCGHVACCMSCLTEIKANNGVCPICRSKIDQVVKLYTV
ncbi:Cdk-activating kinase assembly factor [Parasponia andersonii]|uniref:Cdk-activating kinase assembly factor n=1 Tax=Parasponia andersonii TaxID=3476 RepID=A0A2P5CV27_PARAD|nr:Cdk-activating kinase assembly factor [Parasponia andersonii]